jgi:hypothetical protein
MNKELIRLYMDMLTRDGMVIQTKCKGNTFFYTIDADEVQSGTFVRIIQKHYKLTPKNTQVGGYTVAWTERV